MNTLPYLNLGCGLQYSPQWVNVDFYKSGEGVIAHNLLKGVPFEDNKFGVVYHSHVLEHFPKDKAKIFIQECYRVLKPGGIIRIAVPDLEQIVHHYSRLFALGKADPDNEKIWADYDWIMTEMYDQAVRNESGGEMAKYLSVKRLDNEDFVFGRIGNEGATIRENIIQAMNEQEASRSSVKKSLGRIKRSVLAKSDSNPVLRVLFGQYKLKKLARFRQSGEIHQWMYDSYSLGHLLKSVGFKSIEKKDFDKSNIPDWRSFSLDEINDAVVKPDSLFIEAIK